MEEELRRIQIWATHGTIRQFENEAKARLAEQGYTIERRGDTLSFYKVSRQGGFLGIGSRKVKELVLQVIGEGDAMRIPEETADAEFVKQFAALLGQH